MNQIQVCRSPGAWPRGVESALRAHAPPVCPAATPPALPSMDHTHALHGHARLHAGSATPRLGPPSYRTAHSRRKLQAAAEEAGGRGGAPEEAERRRAVVIGKAAKAGIHERRQLRRRPVHHGVHPGARACAGVRQAGGGPAGRPRPPRKRPLAALASLASYQLRAGTIVHRLPACAGPHRAPARGPGRRRARLGSGARTGCTPCAWAAAGPRPARAAASGCRARAAGPPPAPPRAAASPRPHTPSPWPAAHAAGRQGQGWVGHRARPRRGGRGGCSGTASARRERARAPRAAGSVPERPRGPRLARRRRRAVVQRGQRVRLGRRQQLDHEERVGGHARVVGVGQVEVRLREQVVPHLRRPRTVIGPPALERLETERARDSSGAGNAEQRATRPAPALPRGPRRAAAATDPRPFCSAPGPNGRRALRQRAQAAGPPARPGHGGGLRAHRGDLRRRQLLKQVGLRGRRPAVRRQRRLPRLHKQRAGVGLGIRGRIVEARGLALQALAVARHHRQRHCEACAGRAGRARKHAVHALLPAARDAVARPTLLQTQPMRRESVTAPPCQEPRAAPGPQQGNSWLRRRAAPRASSGRRRGAPKTASMRK